jgi:choline dehydrogenase-like flavoprotein
VVGSGPGGAITACLLAEAGRDVLLIEEGAHWSPDSCLPFGREEMLQKYRHGGQTVAFGASKIAYVEGRCAGGGSEINSGLYHRRPEETLDRWRSEFEMEELSEKQLRPHFETCEKDLSVSFLPGRASEASLKLGTGAQALGWNALEVPRWFRYEGQSGPGVRQSMTRTYLPRFLKAGGKLLAGTRVERLQSGGSDWRLEACRNGTEQFEIKADRVFLACGAVQTPALLLRSGIQRNIGRSLQVHPTVKVIAQFPENVNSTDMGVPVHQVKEFAPRISFGCSISSPSYMALGLLDQEDNPALLRAHWQQMASYYAMITPEGRGQVRNLAGFSAPLVTYRLTRSDRVNLGDGLRKLSELLLAAGAVSLYPGLNGVGKISSAAEVAKLPLEVQSGQANLMTIHLFSSCPMGENRERCATDSFGRVHGFDNLFVSDASLLCTAPGVNPQGTVMALAQRNARAFLKTL